MRVYFGNKEIPDDDLFITNQLLTVVDKVKLLAWCHYHGWPEMGWSSWKHVYQSQPEILHAA